MGFPGSVTVRIQCAAYLRWFDLPAFILFAFLYLDDPFLPFPPFIVLSLLYLLSADTT
jgi:hypothetical protein